MPRHPLSEDSVSHVYKLSQISLSNKKPESSHNLDLQRSAKSKKNKNRGKQEEEREPLRARASDCATSLDSSATQEDSLPFTVKDKVILSGDNIEHYRFEIPLFARMGNARRRHKKKNPSFEAFANFERWASPPERKFRTSSLNRIRRLVATNFRQDAKFFTLTFADTNAFRLDDFDKCNYEFKKFIQRLKGHHPNIRYLAVPEFQKRGALHYHLVIDIPFIEQKLLQDIWRMGFVFVQRLKKTHNISAYIAKYLKKNASDSRFYGKKTYFCSKGLIQPTVLYGKEALAILSTAKDKQQTYQKEYPSLMNGTVTYTQYEISSEELTS